mgnify:FL=1
MGSIGGYMELHCFNENELLTGISILAVLRHTKQLELSKCMLIEPILSYSAALQSLCRTNSNIKSIEDFMIKQSISFANFNDRYQENLLLSLNSILLFSKLQLISFNGKVACFSGDDFDFEEPTLGRSARKRIVASKKLAEILQKGDASDFYLSLRIEV